MINRNDEKQDRKIVLYFKATGYKPEEYDRMTEIECIELINDEVTGHFHKYIHPEDKEIPHDAIDGIGQRRLNKIRHASTFTEIAPDLMNFICPPGQDKPSIIVFNGTYVDRHFHYAMTERFNPDFTALADSDYCHQFIDVLEMARKLHPNKKGQPTSNTLESLCARYNINVSERDCYSAKGDAELLRQIYFKLVNEMKNRKSGFQLFTKPEAATQTTQAVKPVQQSLTSRRT